MTQFGVTAAGFKRPTLAQILARIEARQLATIDPELDVSPEGTIGKLNLIYAEEFDLIWGAAEAVYNSNDPDAAAGAALLSLAKLTGTERRAGVPSEVDITSTFAEGVELVAGTHFAEVAGDSSNRWTPKVNFTAPAAGSHVVRFVNEQIGPIDAAVNAITVIATPVVGWGPITASSEPELGRDADDDAALRDRRAAQLTRAGSATARAIVADLLEICDAASVLENKTDSIDVNNLPPHSFEAIVLSTATDDEIAQVILGTASAGIRSVGSSSGTATDAEGAAHPIAFTRVAEVEVYLDFTLTTGPAFVAATFKAAVAFAADQLHDTGDDVLWSRLIALAWAEPGIENVASLRLGFAASPTLSADLAIGEREIARFDAGRITLA